MATLAVGGTTVFDGSALQSGVTGTIGTGVTFPTGHVIQVVNNINDLASASTLVDTGSAASPSAYNTWVAMVDCTITPHKANSKILIDFNVRYGLSNSDHHSIVLVQQIGTTYTAINRAASNSNHFRGVNSGAFRDRYSSTYTSTMLSDMSLDIPSSTGSYSSGTITYSCRIARYTPGGTVYVNRTEANRDNATDGYDGHSTSTMTLMEVAI